ncbi:MAG: AAA family ATPase, partial [Coriobacteriia bacterium]|nr:AAA family ATPase [Coriobacteriia bacterium]
MRIEIPELAVVALIGVSGSGKSSFAARYFQPTEVLSSDYFRAMISDDIENQAVSADAFDALYYLANKRLSRGLSVVIDATNVQRDARAAVLHLAKEQDCQAVAIVLDMPEQLCNERNAQREDRRVTAQVVRRQAEQLRRSIRHLKKEGFRRIYVLKSAEEAADVEITRIPLWSNKKDESGPFDIIGDVHGCYGKLCELLEELGYAVDPNTQTATPPPTRKAIFLGDLCDRGPDNVQVLQLVMNMVEAGAAYCVAGNHEAKLLRKLRGADVKLNHGLADTVQQLETYVATSQDDSFMPRLESFLDGLISHYMLDGASLVVAHAGLKEKYHGRSSGRVRSFCLYGDTTGETDEYGLPVRLPWAREYRGKPLVVYGHTPTLEVEAVNNTYCIDTGCVFGGKLSALRYPERQVVQVDAAEAYYEPIKPLHIGATGPATPPPDD